MHPIDFPYTDDFCDDEVFVFSTMGQGPRGPEGPEGKVDEQLINAAVSNWLEEHPEATAMLSLADVRRYGAVEKSNENDWTSILTSVAENSDVIYFPAGDWDLNGGITIPQNITRVCGFGARLFSSTSCDYLMQIAQRYTEVAGITFDGMGIVNKLLYSAGETGNRLSPIIGCQFLNIGTGNYGILNEYIGLHIVGCTFGTNAKTDAIYGGIGIKTHTDNQISACKFFRFDYAIAGMGANISNCYFWATKNESGIVFVPEKFLADYENAGQTYDVIFLNCEFDCIRTICYNPRNVVVTHCQFYWNDKDIDTDCYLFMLSSRYNKIGSLEFSSNIIKFQNISYDVYMWSSDSIRQGTEHEAFIAGYVSRDNIMTTSVYNMNSLSHYHLLCGWTQINDYLRSSSRNVVSYLQCDALNTYPTARYSIIANLCRYDRIRANASSDARAIYLFSPLRNNIKSLINVYWNDDTPNEVLPFGSFTINQIEVNVAPLLMIAMNDYSTTDFDPTDYQSVGCQVIAFS